MNTDLLDNELENDEFRLEFLQGIYVETFLGMIEDEMKKQGVTRSELAKRMGCAPANITRIFRSDSNLTSRKMVQLADVLGLDFVPELKQRKQSTPDKPAFVTITGLSKKLTKRPWALNESVEIHNDNMLAAA